MSLLRIYASLTVEPQRCEWVIVNSGREPVTGEGRLVELPQGCECVQWVIPADQVLLTRAQVPNAARRRAGSVLAFAVEDQTLGEPDSNQVSWLGKAETAAGDDDVLAVVNKQALLRWRNALRDAGIRDYELQCEMLLLPRKPGEWSMAWDGQEGFIRSGELEGVATDRGDRMTPPQSLRLMLEEAAVQGARPSSIALYMLRPDAQPDMETWQRSLASSLRLAGSWDWRRAPENAGIRLAQEQQRWRLFAGMATRFRPAVAIFGAALAIHASALTLDWISLAREQRALRQNMESQFRAVFPDAVAVVDPALQMRRKLAEVRYATGLPDEGDFLPLIEKVAMGVNDLPAGSLRALSYESGRLTFELAADDEATRWVVVRLRQAGLNVNAAPASVRSEGGVITPQEKTQVMAISVWAP